MGQSNVTFCYPRITPAGLTILTPAARVESLTPVSLTPIRCDRFECHPATSSPPELASCKIVAQTLLNNFTGTVTLPPKQLEQLLRLLNHTILPDKTMIKNMITLCSLRGLK
ncbi:hypothetical protein MJO29_012970 [Puccinia striiformis f. sp. tritici]|nr:hypothetical protein MJO29_012970 [Puccinia striiformis f. sp. tritici]